AEPSGLIDPVERVVNARPSQASGRAAAGIRRGVDKETQAPLVDEPGMHIHVAREVGHERLQLSCTQTADLIHRHHLYGFSREDFLADALASVAQDHLHELDVVGRSRIEPSY